MPYRKRYRKKKRSKLPWYERKYTASQLAKKAWKTAKWLKSVVNVEKKICDTTPNGGVSSSGTVVPITTVAQGDSQIARDGNSIKCTSLLMRGTFTQNPSATNSYMRVIYFIDNQQIADTTPGVTDVLQSASVTSPLNPSSLGRFSIIKDMQLSFSATGTTAHMRELLS